MTAHEVPSQEPLWKRALSSFIFMLAVAYMTFAGIVVLFCAP